MRYHKFLFWQYGILDQMKQIGRKEHYEFNTQMSNKDIDCYHEPLIPTSAYK